MPLFMDMHSIDGGVSASDAAAAHQADLATQAGYGVNYLRYWVDEETGKIFCLVEAPDAEAANTVHRKAHGLVADEIYPVSEHRRVLLITSANLTQSGVSKNIEAGLLIRGGTAPQRAAEHVDALRASGDLIRLI